MHIGVGPESRPGVSDAELTFVGRNPSTGTLGLRVTSTDKLRILVACEDPGAAGELATAAGRIGHEVITAPADLVAVQSLVDGEPVDVAMVSVGPSSDWPLEVIDLLIARATCPVIAVVRETGEDCIEKASRVGVHAVVSAHASAQWNMVIDVVMRRFAEYQKLHGAFVRRAAIERASGILMERHSVDADAALRMLRDTARRRNQKLSDLASAVVDGHSLLPMSAR